MANYGMTGSPVVDAVGKMNITGNVIPISWFRTITNHNGRPNTNAIMILSDIVYWYRPVIERDEISGDVTGYRRKFKNDMLKKSYSGFEKMFGLSRRQIRDALCFLEELRVIKRVFRVEEIGGEMRGNVMYIQLFPDALRRLTYLDEYDDKAGKDNTDEDDPVKTDTDDANPVKTDENNIGAIKNDMDNAALVRTDDVMTEEIKKKEDNTDAVKIDTDNSGSVKAEEDKTEDTPVDKNVNPCLQNCNPLFTKMLIGVYKNVNSPNIYNNINTIENNKEINKENILSIPSSTVSLNKQRASPGMKTDDDMTEIVKSQVDYEKMIKKSPCSKDFFNKCIEIMAEAYGFDDSSYTKMGLRTVNNRLLKEKLFKITGEHILNIYESITRTYKYIQHEKAYILSCLFNESGNPSPREERLKRIQGSSYYKGQREYDFDELEKLLINR